MDKKNIFVSIVGLAGKEDFRSGTIIDNIELASFAMPDKLDAADAQNFARASGQHLKSQGVRVGMHGPVMDLYYDSRDPKVREVAKNRILQGLQIAELLGAEFMVAHSTYNKQVASKKYPESWRKNSAGFWREMTDVAEEKKIRIVFENIWDTRPEMIQGVIEDVNSPNFKACLDVGHFNLFSEVSIEEWLSVWGENLSHLHLHNNHGDYDDHNGFTDGTFNFDAFFKAMSREKADPTMTIEVRHLEDLEPSRKDMLTYLEKYGDSNAITT